MSKIQRYINAGAILSEDFRDENSNYTYTNTSSADTPFGKRLYFINGSFTMPELTYTSYMYWYNGHAYAYDGTDSYKDGVIGSEDISVTSTGFSGVSGYVSDLVFFDRVISAEEIVAFSSLETFDYSKKIFTDYDSPNLTESFDAQSVFYIGNNRKSDGISDLGLTQIQLDDFIKRNKGLYVQGEINYDLIGLWNYDVTDLTKIGQLGVGSQLASQGGIYIRPDGTSLFFGDLNDNIVQYNLSTPFDVSTGTHYKTTAWNNKYPLSLYITPDGLTVISSYNGTPNLMAHTLGSPWDITSVTYSKGKNLSEDGAFRSIMFNTDGTECILKADTGTGIYRYTLSTPYDISTMVLEESSTIGGDYSCFISEDLMHIIQFGMSNSRLIYDYKLDEPFRITNKTLVATGDTTSVGLNSPLGVVFSEDTGMMYTIDSGELCAQVELGTVL